MAVFWWFIASLEWALVVLGFGDDPGTAFQVALAVLCTGIALTFTVKQDRL